VTSTNIAQILNIYPQKGAILPGSDADIVVWDPKLSKTISAANQKSIIDYNVFEGFKVNGQARYTLSRGEVVWHYGQNSQPKPGRGKLVKRKPFPAVNKALSTWKELTAPRAVTRSAEHMPIGV
jgi:dihydropyrimidinase